jgi:hypothetical protein
MLCTEVTSPEQLSRSNDNAVAANTFCTDNVDVIAITPLPSNNNSIPLLNLTPPPTPHHSPYCPPPSFTATAAMAASVAIAAATAGAQATTSVISAIS